MNITKEELERLYIDEKMSMDDIGTMCGVTHTSVWRWLRRNNIPTRTDRSTWRGRKNGIPYSAETIEKMRVSKLGSKNARFGVHLSDETKEKMSKRLKGKHNSPDAIARQRATLTGFKQSEATKEHMRIARRKFLDEFGISEETRKAQSIGRSGIKHNDETKRKLREFHLGKPLPIETRQKMTASLLKNWQKPEYRDKTTRLVMLANHIKPNKPETFIMTLLDKMYPNEYIYTGDGALVIGGKCPDFCNENKKKLILFHGIYWHLIKFQSVNPNLTKEQVEQKDIAHYEKHGYDTLIIWEDEMVDVNKVLSRISQFNMVVVSDS